MQASERRPTELFFANLEATRALAAELGVKSDGSDYDVGWTTDDLLDERLPRRYERLSVHRAPDEDVRKVRASTMPSARRFIAG